MSHLALNTVLPQMLRVKYQVAIGVAPIGLMFASFGPGFLFASWLEGALGIPPNSPINAHPNGTMWITLFLATMVALMVLGYALGWLVNQAVSRWVLGWSQQKVRAVYANSDVPSHWLKAGADLNADPGAKTIAKWEQQRKVGVLRFVLTRGLLAWGLPMFIAMYAAPAFFNGHPLVVKALLFNVALWAVAGAGFGAIIWYSSEAHYRKLKKRGEA
jgi:hypothetical protein